MNNCFRLALVGGGLFAATAAHALTIDFIWHGAYGPGVPAAGMDSVAASSNVAGSSVLDLVPGSVPITGVLYSYTVGAAATAGSGWLWLGAALPNTTGAGAAFSFQFTGNNTSDGMNGMLLTINGLAGGPYAGYTSLSGQLSHTDHAYPNDPNGFTAGGQFSSVPEPVSLGALGVGLLGLIRRRVVTTR